MSSYTARRSTTQHARRDHYSEVTDKIIAALEAGTPPWRKPWDPEKAGGPAMPRNATTGARYRGINTLILGMSPRAFETGDPRWATYKQAAEHGWQVRKGERGTTAFFFKRIEVRDDKTDTGGDGDEAARHIPLLRAFTLFHASQIDGIPAYQSPTIAEAPWRAPDATETIVRNSGAVIRIGGDRAFYSPGTDHIQLPPPCSFATAAGFVSTQIHEMSHWTAKPSRLNRDLRNAFGSHDYAREELRAELGQVIVCSELSVGCEFANSAAYVADWLERLRSDRKEIFRAAADAQRIADYLLAFHPEYASVGGTSPEGAGSVAAESAATGEAVLAEAA